MKRPRLAPSTESFSTIAAAPIVVNTPATAIGYYGADFGCEVTGDGGEPPIVTIYYGDNDGEMTPGNWDFAVVIGEQTGVFTDSFFGLTHNTFQVGCLPVTRSGRSADQPDCSSMMVKIRSPQS